MARIGAAASRARFRPRRVGWIGRLRAQHDGDRGLLGVLRAVHAADQLARGAGLSEAGLSLPYPITPTLLVVDYNVM